MKFVLSVMGGIVNRSLSSLVLEEFTYEWPEFRKKRGSLM